MSSADRGAGIALRPHHLLCIRYFRGNGYSPAFVENMQRVIARLEKEDPAVTLVCGADGLCASCPHDADGRCDSADKVDRYDAAVLRLCGLREGERARWSDLRRLVVERILRPDLRPSVCGGCQWETLCR